MQETWITVDQAAQRLGKSRRTVYRWLSSGRMRSRVSTNGRREVLIMPPVVEVAPNLPTETLDDEPVEDVARPASGAAEGLDFLVDAHPGLGRRIDEIAAASDMSRLQADLNAVELDRTRRGWRKHQRMLWTAVVAFALAGVAAQWYSLHKLSQVQRHLDGQKVSAGMLAGELQGEQDTNSTLSESNDALRARVTRLQDEVRQLRTDTALAQTPWPPTATDPEVMDLPDIPAP